MPLRSRRTSVLLVDDDADVLDAYAQYLETADIEVNAFSDSRDVIDAAARLKPDVIVLDLAMPGLNGYDVVEALQCRRDTGSIPVILFSGWPREPKKESPQVRAYFEKSCMPADLLALVRTIGGQT
jgi:CheY-like chemotaxis protein